MPAFAGLQLLTYGLGCIYSGWRLCNDPTGFLQQLAPILDRLEYLAKSKAGISLARVQASSFQSPGLAFAGLLLMAFGYMHCMTVYTLDEKAKRNSTSGRLILAAGAYWLCQQTPHGSSLMALFGIINLISGLAMGLSVGFGDGNAVDLEIKERIEARKRAAAAAKAQPAGSS